MAKNGGLSTKQHRAIATLLTEPTIESAAKSAKVGYRTLERWLAEDAAFQKALAEAEAEAIAQAARLVAGHVSDAIKLLADLVNDEAIEPKERRQAAAVLLAHLPRLRILSSLEARLAEIEDSMGDDLRGYLLK